MAARVRNQKGGFRNCMRPVVHHYFLVIVGLGLFYVYDYYYCSRGSSGLKGAAKGVGSIQLLPGVVGRLEAMCRFLQGSIKV